MTPTVLPGCTVNLNQADWSWWNRCSSTVACLIDGSEGEGASARLYAVGQEWFCRSINGALAATHWENSEVFPAGSVAVAVIWLPRGTACAKVAVKLAL